MASVFVGIRVRFKEILCDGRGSAGPPSFTTHCRDVVRIPAGTFRFPRLRAPLIDPRIDSKGMDRAISILWRKTNNADGGWNELAGRGQKKYRMELSNAVVFGAGAETSIKIYGSETATTLIDYEAANERVHSDQVWIERAITLPELYGNDTDPVISSIKQEEDTVLTEVNGRLVVMTPYLVMLDFSHSVAYRP